MPEDDPSITPGTRENDEAKRARRGHPTGAHIRHQDQEGPPHMSEYLRDGRSIDLRDLVLQANPPAPPIKPKLDLSLNIPTVVLLAGMLWGGVQGWGNLNERIASNERGVQEARERATKYVPVIESLTASMQAQVSENKNQNDRLQTFATAIADERKARQDDNAEGRSTQTAQLALIAKLTDKLADIDKAVAVMGASGRRSELPSAQRDAQATPGR